MTETKKIKVLSVKRSRFAQKRLREKLLKMHLYKEVEELDKICGINNSNVKKLQQNKINSKDKVLHSL